MILAAVFFATFKFFESLSETSRVASQSLHDVRRACSAKVAWLCFPVSCCWLQESCAEYVKYFSETFL